MIRTGLHDSLLHDMSWTDDGPVALVDDAAPAASVSSAPVTVGAGAAVTQALFLQETGDATVISVNDLHQGQLGDCFLISSIGELALTRPAAITNMIHANANGTETVTLYTATNGHVAGFGATAFKATTVTIDNNFSTSSVNSGAGQDVANGQKEIWAQVLEKAVATLDGGINAISDGGNPMIAMQELTGHAATCLSPTQLSQQALQSYVNAGDLITMDTANGLALPYNLVGSHAYMFEKMVSSNGQTMVQLGNPWGFAQPALIPLAQLAKAGIVEVDVGRVA